MFLARCLAVAVGLSIVAVVAGCGVGPGSPLDLKVVDGERAEKYTGTQAVQYYRWWADLELRNNTDQPLTISLDSITYGKEQDVDEAGTARADGKVYARADWPGDGGLGENGGSGKTGRADERITVAPSATLELQDVGFESHPESTQGTIRVAVQGKGISESAPIDFMTFKSR